MEKKYKILLIEDVFWKNYTEFGNEGWNNIEDLLIEDMKEVYEARKEMGTKELHIESFYSYLKNYIATNQGDKLVDLDCMEDVINFANKIDKKQYADLFYSHLKENIESKLDYSVDLDITQNVADAIQKIESNEYDLVVTDIGLPHTITENFKHEGSEKEYLDKKISEMPWWDLGVPADEYKTWSEIIPEHTARFHELRSQKIEGEDTNKELEEERIGAYIATLAQKKFPTVIHSATSHFNGNLDVLYQTDILKTREDMLNLAEETQREKKEQYKKGNIYLTSKFLVEDFVYVINDAIKNHVLDK